MRRSARLSDQPRRTYFEDNGDEVKKPSKLTKNDEESIVVTPNCSLCDGAQE